MLSTVEKWVLLDSEGEKKKRGQGETRGELEGVSLGNEEEREEDVSMVDYKVVRDEQEEQT